MSGPASQPGGTRRAGKPEGAYSGTDISQLLKAGGWLLFTGVVSVTLIDTVFGGITQHGAHTNGGWLLLVLAAACLPLGFLLFLLGATKWLSRRKR